MKTLLIVSADTPVTPRTDEQRQRERNGEWPRTALIEDTLNADVINQTYLKSLLPLQRLLYRPLPAFLIQALEAFRLRRKYDAVITWDDRVTLVYAALLMLARVRQPRHVAVVTWMAPVTKGLLVHLVHKAIDRIILWGAFQRDLLSELFKVPSSKIVATSYWVDHHFFHPVDLPCEGICSVGNSMRDYATLAEAMRGLPIACRIITVASAGQTVTRDWAVTGGALASVRDLPENIVVQSAEYPELRRCYATSRFVVVPLFPSVGDFGITAIAESMAMGKAVVCSRIRGLPDFVEDGVTALLVPPGDPKALRDAIQYLWEHPEVAARMGAEGRRRAEDLFSLDSFAAKVKRIVDEVVGAPPQPAPGGDLRQSAAQSFPGQIVLTGR